MRLNCAGKAGPWSFITYLVSGCVCEEHRALTVPCSVCLLCS